MIRKKTGLKELTLVVLCGAALVSVACGDDDDTGGDGTSGSAGTTTAGSKSTGGSAGSKSTGGSAGTGTGGTSSAGTGNGGTSSAGTSGGGTGGTGGTAGSSVGGEPSGGVPSDGGMAGEGGAPIIGGADAGGAGGEGGEPPVVVLDTLKNASFETWNADKTIVAEWVNTATPSGASYFQWGSGPAIKNGEYKLAHWDDVAYTARTEQVVSPIANGKYKFSIFVNRDALTDLNESYVYAKGYKATALAEEQKTNTDAAVGDAWVEIAVTDIQVTSGAITVGFYTDAKIDGWINFDDASLVRLGD
jgi:hypothetical protein